MKDFLVFTKNALSNKSFAYSKNGSWLENAREMLYTLIYITYLTGLTSLT